MVPTNLTRRIVEYATREQAQTAVATLSNQNLMGRLVYVREVRNSPTNSFDALLRRNIGSRGGTTVHRFHW